MKTELSLLQLAGYLLNAQDVQKQKIGQVNKIASLNFYLKYSTRIFWVWWGMDLYIINNKAV